MKIYVLDNNRWVFRELTETLLTEHNITISKPAQILGEIKVADNVQLYDGEFYGGEFWGGEFYGGVYRGGEFYGGVYRGGEFYGGVFWGGEWHISPLQIQMSQFFFNVAAPGILQIGCECHKIAEWQTGLKDILGKHGTSVLALESEIRIYIELAVQWHKIHNLIKEGE